MHARLDGGCGGVGGPGEEGAEGEVLDDGEFGEDFGVVHFYHALVCVRVFGWVGCWVGGEVGAVENRGAFAAHRAYVRDGSPC